MRKTWTAKMASVETDEKIQNIYHHSTDPNAVLDVVSRCLQPRSISVFHTVPFGSSEVFFYLSVFKGVEVVVKVPLDSEQALQEAFVVAMLTEKLSRSYLKERALVPAQQFIFPNLICIMMPRYHCTLAEKGLLSVDAAMC